MVLQIYKPTFPLDKFIKNFIYCNDLSISHNLDRFLPDGNPEFIIDLAEKPQHIYDNEKLQEVQVCRSGWATLNFAMIALFERRSWKYIFINGGFITVYFTLIGFILGLWR